MFAAFRTQSREAFQPRSFLPFRKGLASIRAKYYAHQSRSGCSFHLAVRSVLRLPFTPFAFE